MSEENKVLMRRVIEETINNKNLSLIDELYASNHVMRNNLEEPSHGPEGVREDYNMYLTAFPDVHLTIEDMIAEGDKVVVPYTVRGTHRGELMGIAPTGKQITVLVVWIARIADGKLVESQLIFDAMGMMQQLGVIPAQE